MTTESNSKAAIGLAAKPRPPKIRDRVAEGRYQMHADELRELRADRRELALRLRDGGYAWAEIGAVLGVTAGAARMLARRA